MTSNSRAPRHSAATPTRDRADGTDRRQTRPEPVETRASTGETPETDEIWLEVQEF